MGAADRRVVIVEDIRSYSTITFTSQERAEVLREVKHMVGYQSRESRESQSDTWLHHLRNTLEWQGSIIEMDRREHSRLECLVKERVKSESIIERLKDAEPKCRWCNHSARYQLQIDGADPVLACQDCVVVLDTPHAYRLLQEIDPTVAPATEIVINDSAVIFPTNLKQTFLSNFTDPDSQPPSHNKDNQSTRTS